MTILENVYSGAFHYPQSGRAGTLFHSNRNPPPRWLKPSSSLARRDLPLFVLGGGSNLVVSDAGWPGLVLKLAVRGIDERRENGKTLFEVGAGEEWDRFVARAVARNCAGVECLSGIPGSVGGTPVQNVGAYGQEVSETINSVLTLDLRDGQIRELCAEACGFQYRTSIFNTSERGRFIILRVTYASDAGRQTSHQYADLKRHFAGLPADSFIDQHTRGGAPYTGGKAMLITPGDEDCRSAGSFFKNPVLSADQYRDLTKRAAAKGLQIPSYPALDSQRKVSQPPGWSSTRASARVTSGRVGNFA